jgi:hypothetical protein
LDDFSEKDLEAQRDMLDNFAELNRPIKQERKSTPRGFFDEEPIEPVRMKSPEPRTIVSDPLPRNKGVKRPGQANSEKIAELEHQLSQLRRSIDDERSVSKPRSSRAKRTVDRNIAELIRGKRPPKRSKAPAKELTPSRIAAGSFLDKAICGAARLSQNLPPSDPSDSSSSSSSSSEHSATSADESSDGG